MSLLSDSNLLFDDQSISNEIDKLGHLHPQLVVFDQVAQAINTVVAGRYDNFCSRSRKLIRFDLG